MGEDQSAPAPVTWWRRNRWALLALPLVLVVVALSGAGRVAMFWWPNEFHDRTEGTLALPTTFTDSYRDAGGDHARTLQITVLRVTADPQITDDDGTPLTEDPLPAGMRAWEVELSLAADPELPLGGCQLALVDAQGRRAERDTSHLPFGASIDPCQSHDTVNPQYQLFVDEAEHDPSTRPPAYSRTVQLLVAQDFEPTEVRLWWEPPSYLAVPLPDVVP